LVRTSFICYTERDIHDFIINGLNKKMNLNHVRIEYKTVNESNNLSPFDLH